MALVSDTDVGGEGLEELRVWQFGDEGVRVDVELSLLDTWAQV